MRELVAPGLLAGVVVKHGGISYLLGQRGAGQRWEM